MTVLDTLTSGSEPVGQRWVNLLTRHGVTEADAELIYALRCSLLHGYGPPKPSAGTDNRIVLLTDDRFTFAVDTRRWWIPTSSRRHGRPRQPRAPEVKSASIRGRGVSRAGGFVAGRRRRALPRHQEVLVLGRRIASTNAVASVTQARSP